MINLQNVYLSYTKEYYTLFDVSFEVADGKTVVVLGKEESGKSTLMRLIAGFEKPTMGTVTIKGVDSAKVDFRNSVSMGYLPSEGVFKENQSVIKNLQLPLKLRKEDKDIMDIKVNNAIVAYDLGTTINVKVRQLQPFDRIKVALARFSLRNIDLFVIDDVFSTVSSNDATKLAKYICDLIKNNDATAVVACSDEKIAKLFKGEIIKLEQGSIAV